MTKNMERILKQERLEKKLTLDDITRTLKIRKDHIRQFEKKIPESLDVYKLGYLRSYAKYLNVDINDYIEDLKEKAAIAIRGKQDTSKNKIFKTIKTPAGIITIILSIIGLILSIMFLGVMDKEKLSISHEQSNLKQNEPTINTPNKARFSVDKKGPYDYLVSGIGSDNEINIVARVNTTFTMTDPAKNKIVSRGVVRTGERLFIPKDQDSKNFTSLLIKTNVPDAFDVQQIIEDK